MTPRLSLTDTFVSSVADGSPAILALTLAYAKLHIRALGTADDVLTAVRIQAAASYFFTQTGRSPLTQTREAWLDAFPFLGASGSAARIELPHPPLRSVDRISYIDGDGVLRDFTDGASPAVNLWTVQAPTGDYAPRGYVEPIFGQTWPIARVESGAVRLRYTCGYSDTAEDVPALVQGILCYLTAHFDQFPSIAVDGRSVQDVPVGMEMMLNGFKYSALPTQVLRESAVLGWTPSW